MLRLIIACLVLSGCSRLGLGTGLTLSFPFDPDQSGFAADDVLKKTVVYVRIPGRAEPIVQVKTYKDADIPRGQDLTLDLANAPKGSGYFIQFLAIYENSTTGATKFYYGDAPGVVGDSNTVEITTDDVGESDKMIVVEGRYLTAPNVGPTGKVVGHFFPPNGREPMKISETDIVDGWFSVKWIESREARIRYSYNGTVLFDDLRDGADELVGYGPTLLKMIKPPTFHIDQGQTKASPEAGIYLGVWGQTVGQKVCFVDPGAELVSAEFLDSSLSSPLQYRPMSGSGLQLRQAAGGVPQTYAALPTAGCTLTFDHQRPSTPCANCH